jgi:predicted CXXCH cytochrome family protein
MSIERFLVVVIFILIATPGYTFPPPGQFDVEVSRESKFCLGCHDVVAEKKMSTSHPVDIDYRAAQANSKGRLKPVSQIDPAVKLEKGKVVCTSCHDPNSSLPAKLVISNTGSGSRLCVACHNL